MRHAYLIIAHSNWNQLKLLLQCLDSVNADIYIHIDKRAKDVPVDDIKKVIRFSKIEVYREYKVYWGSFELVQVELLLFKKASENHYDYYHLISGMDLPIKPKKYIDDFFEKNKGLEFIHYDTNVRLQTDKELNRRTRYYHFLQNYRRRYRFAVINAIFTLLERCSLAFQIVLHVNRMKKYSGFQIRYGSQWVSITDNLVNYIISQETFIYKVFKYTNCADELFIQSLVFNSDFKNNIYDKRYDDDVCANMRLIDIKKRGKNGNPYIWRVSDLKEIESSECLFARKFDSNVDDEIIKIISNINYSE